MKLSFKVLLCLVFCNAWQHGFSQSFVKTYTDLPIQYEGLNILPVANSQTAVIGLYYGTKTFAIVVDSMGTPIDSGTNYLRNTGNDIGSNLIQLPNGFAFYHSANSWSLSGNDLEVTFVNDSLRQINDYIFQYGCYDCNFANINLNYVKPEGVFFTGTEWGINSNIGPWRFNANYGTITKLDSTGNLLWSNNWGPWDSANPCQIFNSIITSDSNIAVMGVIHDSIHLKKYNFNGYLKFDHTYNLLQNNVTGYVMFARQGYNYYGELIETNKNLLAFGSVTYSLTNTYQLALEVLTLHDSLINQKKFVLQNNVANITPIAVYTESDTTVLLNYTIVGSTLDYYLIVDYKGDSIGSFSLPAYTVSTSYNGNILYALDSNNSIIVREYTQQGTLIYKYAYQPSDTLNFCNDIKPLPYPGRFVLTGSSDNDLLIIRQDTSITTVTENKLLKIPENISILPNPSNGNFILLLSNITEKCNVEIFNYLGESIYKSKVNSNSTEIDLSSQPDGIYLYRVLKEDGSLVGDGKVVIEQ